jgi:hypothetical protein
MKKKIALFTVLAFSALVMVSIIGCAGGDKYADVKAVIGETIKVQQTFIDSVNKAATPKDIVAALDVFATSMKALKPKAADVDAKHPELKEGKMPKDIESMVKQSEEISNQLGEKAMTKIMTKFGKDKEVQKALQKFVEAMQSLQ